MNSHYMESQTNYKTPPNYDSDDSFYLLNIPDVLGIELGFTEPRTLVLILSPFYRWGARG